MEYIELEKALSMKTTEELANCWEPMEVIFPEVLESLPKKSQWDIAIEAINEIKKNSDLPDTWRGALTLTVIMLKKVRQRKSKIEIELEKREWYRKNEYHEGERR